ncbi:hypothetical protein ADP71_12290 [Vitreoscilla sp. C1]|nr:hypothetical protein ADP71_12290 [Vitreoscilla sp. C1]
MLQDACIGSCCILADAVNNIQAYPKNESRQPVNWMILNQNKVELMGESGYVLIAVITQIG